MYSAVALPGPSVQISGRGEPIQVNDRALTHREHGGEARIRIHRPGTPDGGPVES